MFTFKYFKMEHNLWSAAFVMISSSVTKATANPTNNASAKADIKANASLQDIQLVATAGVQAALQTAEPVIIYMVLK